MPGQHVFTEREKQTEELKSGQPRKNSVSITQAEGLDLNTTGSMPPP